MIASRIVSPSLSPGPTVSLHPKRGGSHRDLGLAPVTLPGAAARMGPSRVRVAGGPGAGRPRRMEDAHDTIPPPGPVRHGRRPLAALAHARGHRYLPRGS